MLVESLEHRVLLAGNVVVAVDGAATRVSGDASANIISIVFRDVDGKLIVTGFDGTTINGLPAVEVNVRPALAVDLGGGDDMLSIDRLIRSTGQMNLGVNLGAGNDTIYLKRASLQAADIHGGDGDDRIDITASTFSKRLRVFGGAQNDTVGLGNVRARQGFDISDLEGASWIALGAVSASGVGRGASYVGTGHDADRLEILNSDFEAFSTKLKDGADAVYVRGTTFKTESPIDSGRGQNRIDRQVILSYDFNDGAQEWLAGLSGVLPYDLSNPPGRAELFANNEGEYGLRPMPAETGLTTHGYYLSAMAYWLYLQKQVGSSQGVVGGLQYDVGVSVDLGTNTMGSGGLAFGSYVNVNAGALSRRVKIDRIDHHEYATVNAAFDSGWGRVGEIQFLGLAYKNDGALTPPVGEGQYRVVRRQAEAFPVTATAEGDVWLVVAQTGRVDYEFTAPSETRDVYFAKVKFVLTPVTE